jgi:hypothetical protein
MYTQPCRLYKICCAFYSLDPLLPVKVAYTRDIVIATNCREAFDKSFTLLLLLLSLSSRRCVDSPSNLFIFPARNSKRERRPRCVVQHLRYSNQFGTVCCVLCLGCVAELHLFFDWRRKRAIWYFPPGSIWHESLAIDRERWVEWFDFSVDGANSKWEFVSPPKRTNKRKTKSVAWMYL